MRRLDRYILATVTTPLLLMMGVAVLLLLLDQMLRLFQFVLDENGSTDVVWRMLATLLPEYIALALPIGFCLGTLFALRKLSLSSELDAGLAAGVPLRRMLSPVYLLALGLFLTNLLITGFVQPVAAYGYSRLQFEVRSSLLTARVKDGAVIEVGEGVTLRVGAVVEGDQPWRNVFFERCEADGTCRAMMAQGGQLLESSEGSGQLVLRLFDVRSVEMSGAGPSAGVGSFAEGLFSLDQEAPGAFRLRGSSRQEVTFPEMVRQLGNPGLDPGRRNELRAALHWRLLHSMLILILPFLGMALGIADKRNDRGFGFIFGVIGVVLYYRLLQAAEGEVAAGLASPWETMWPVFGVYTVGSLVLFWACSERVGFKPFDILDLLFDVVRGWILRLAPRRREHRA